MKLSTLLTIMSSLTQEEFRSISENVKWGLRKRFRDGQVSMAFSNVLGYKKGEDGTIEIDETQAPIVRRIYQIYLEGYGTTTIARTLTKEGVPP